MFVDFIGELQVLSRQSGFLHILAEMTDALNSIIAIVLDIDLQGFLFGTFCGIGHIALRRFLHTIDIRTLSSAYPDFLEVVSPIMVIQAVNRKDLLTLYIGDTEDGGYLVIPILELTLVQ